MVSSKVQGSYFRLAVAGILFSSVYINKSHFFQGFGSARDFSFISLLTTMGVLILF
jgi:Na+-driven multidrug efflux pump